jgi:hypothetical protein
MMHANALLPVMALAAAWGWVTWLGKATGLLITFTVLRNLPGLSFLAPPALA